MEGDLTKAKREEKKVKDTGRASHAWKGTWERPMKVDESALDPLTVARMTDHNVKGSDDEENEADIAEKKTA